MTLGISIVSMNRPNILRHTLRAVLTLGPECPVVIVDNGSTDPETLALLDNVTSRAVVIRNPSNAGLSRAVNQGLHALAQIEQCDLLMHLDDDALLGRIPWGAFESSPSLGLAVPNLQNYSEYLPHPGYNELRWALGYCWIIRRELYERIGGYDPHLLHQQECDYALRVRMAGYHVGALAHFQATHNDPGTEPRSDLSLAREHLGVVQFRDKWCAYFRGAGWNYGTTPLYLMQHWPPDQDWYRRYAEHHGVELNPPPPTGTPDTQPGAVLGLTPETAAKMDAAHRFKISGSWYMPYVDLRNDYAHWERGNAYEIDRAQAIQRWRALTGEEYTSYPWPLRLGVAL